MADKKISALTAASTPLAGTEVLPIVQSGATVKVSVSDLTTGRAVSASQLTLTAGNLIVANGYGVDFSATPGTGTSELLADYEEGTFTPTLTRSSSAPTLTYTAQNGYYTKVGNMVTVQVAVTWSANSGGSGYWYLASLPFTVKNSTNNYGNGIVGSADGFTYAVGTTQLTFQATPAQTFGVFGCCGSAVASSVINTVAATGGIYLTLTYFTA